MRDQERAARAAIQVAGAKEQLGDKAKKFSAKAHALPIWIRVNGLLQAVAFLESKSKQVESQLLVGALKEQLSGAGLVVNHTLSQALAGLDAVAYARYQEESVLCAAWLKRFSAALIGEPDVADRGSAGAEE